MRTPAHAPLVATTRGGHVECIHYGSIAVVDASGHLIAGAGEPESLNFTRSALKPLQALPFVEDGGMERFGFTSHELALMCASHGGESIHVATAERMLKRIDAGATDLQCGSHPPGYYSATGTYMPAHLHWSRLHHNCSGKHSGFLAWCRLHRQPLATYLERDSPLQQRIRDTVQSFAPGVDLPVGTDGCSAPNYALPLTRLAYAFARLATRATSSLAALAFAMTRHPDLVSGTARSDLALMQAGGADWVSKIGADGVQAIGVRSKGIGIAVRIADGNPRALHVATVAALKQLGLIDDIEASPLATMADSVVRNHRRLAVGRIEPIFELPGVLV